MGLFWARGLCHLVKYFGAAFARPQCYRECGSKAGGARVLWKLFIEICLKIAPVVRWLPFCIWQASAKCIRSVCVRAMVPRVHLAPAFTSIVCRPSCVLSDLRYWRAGRMQQQFPRLQVHSG